MLKQGLSVFVALGLLVHPAIAQSDPAAKITTHAPGLNKLCEAVQTAFWNASDDRWDRTRLRPANISCVFMATEAFCADPRCEAQAAIILSPPVVANGKLDPAAMGFRDRYSNVERTVFSAGGQAIAVSVSSSDPKYTKRLMTAIQHGFRVPR